MGRDIAASLKNLVGGELRGYTELLVEARRESLERMMSQAQQLGANAILNVRFTTSTITSGAAELYAYGTAVRIRRVADVADTSEFDPTKTFRKENIGDASSFDR